MASVKDGAEFYDLLLVAPGTDKDIKLDNKISGREGLLLVIALEYSLSNADPANPLGKLLEEQDRASLQTVANSILQKTGAQAFYEKLKRKFA